MSEDMSEEMSEKNVRKECQNRASEEMSEDMSENMSEEMSQWASLLNGLYWGSRRYISLAKHYIFQILVPRRLGASRRLGV